MPRLQRRGIGRRGTVTHAEMVELALGGPGEGEPSLFASSADREAAELSFANLREGWDRADYFLFKQPLIHEQSRRHRPHFAYDDDPRDAAIFDPSRCARCNRTAS